MQRMSVWLGTPLCPHLCPSICTLRKHKAVAAFVLVFYQTPTTVPPLNKDLQPPKNQHSQPPSHPAETLAALPKAEAAGTMSGDGAADGSAGDCFILLGTGGSSCRVAQPGFTWRVQLMNRSVSLAAG